MKIDAYTHFACEALMQHLEAHAGKPMIFRGLFNKIKELCDIQARIAYMDLHRVDAHVLVPLPWIELDPALHANAERSLEACRVANDAMMEVVNTHPDRFLGVALLPTVTSAVMVQEARRALTELGMAGVVLFCGPTVKPLDDPSFEALYAICEQLGAPVWVHPCRPQSYADYDTLKGEGSKYQIWNSLGWVYDTSVNMVHMAMGGVFQRYPNLKVVTHHHGGMIPVCAERFVTQQGNFETKGGDLMEDMRLFYCDTATFGVCPSAIQQSRDYFGNERVLFGTDTPMDMGRSGFFTRTTKEGIESLPAVTKEEKEALYAGNACRMLGIDPTRGRAALKDVAKNRRSRVRRLRAHL